MQRLVGLIKKSRVREIEGYLKEADISYGEIHMMNGFKDNDFLKTF